VKVFFSYKIKQPPARNGCFVWSFEFLFIFGFCTTILFRSYPYIMTAKPVCQQYYQKMIR